MLQAFICYLLPWLLGALIAYLGYLIGRNIWKKRLGLIINEKDGAYNNLNLNYKELQTNNTALNTSLSEKEDRINGLNLNVHDWKSKYESLEKEGLKLSTGSVNVESSLADKDREIEALKEEVNNVGRTFQARLDDWELKYNNLNFRYKDANTKLSKCNEKYEALSNQSNADDAQPTAEDIAYEAELLKDPELAAIRAKSAEFDFGRIGLASVSTKDDLKRIKGVGPYTEKKLNALGIFTFKQVSNLSEEDIPKVNEAIAFFKGRIKRDDWKGQALAFVNNPGLLVAAKYKKDDLKVVEGIGPKIEGLLHDAGIKTWKALSEAATEKIQEVLDAAGGRYRIHDPSTWAKQAEMAEAGDWIALEKWQDELKGGRIE